MVCKTVCKTVCKIVNKMSQINNKTINKMILNRTFGIIAMTAQSARVKKTWRTHELTYLVTD
jgi:hypothetical protein